MREIGGYFGLEDFRGTHFYPDLVAVNSGRNALLYILRAKRIRKLLIPDYLCDSVAKMCERENIDYSRYQVSSDFMPVHSYPLNRGECLYVVNYYGQIPEEVAAKLQDAYRYVILDNVQAFFQRPIPGMDTIYSCRKFFGVPDGGYAATDAVLSEPLLEDKSGDRVKHILGRYEQTASDYYKDFTNNEDRFYGMKLKSMSLITRNILKAVDYDFVRSMREQNFQYLNNRLRDSNRLKLISPSGPYAYPYYTEKAPEIRRALAKKGLYIPVLWPEAMTFGGVAAEYSRNLLPLPIDQRYRMDDMKYMLEEIEKCLKN